MKPIYELSQFRFKEIVFSIDEDKNITKFKLTIIVSIETSYCLSGRITFKLFRRWSCSEKLIGNSKEARSKFHPEWNQPVHCYQMKALSEAAIWLVYPSRLLHSPGGGIRNSTEANFLFDCYTAKFVDDNCFRFRAIHQSLI